MAIPDVPAGSSPWTWWASTGLPILSQIATVLGAAFIVIAAWEIRETRKARWAEAAFKFFDEMDKPDAGKDREFAYHLSPGKALTADESAKVKQLWVSWNHTAAMIEEGILPKNLVLRMFSAAVIMLWDKLKPLIEAERKMRNDEEYLKPFERFASETCLNYWRKSNPGKDRPVPH